MSIMIGGKEPSAIKVGTQDVKAVYAGTEKVWPTAIDLSQITYDPNDLKLVSSFAVGSVSSGGSSTNKNMCIDNPDLWVLLGSSTWAVSSNQGGMWVINANRPDGWPNELPVHDCTWNGEKWCAVTGTKTNNGNLIMLSSDGMNWEMITISEPESPDWKYLELNCVVASEKESNSFYVYGYSPRRAVNNRDVYGPVAFEVFNDGTYRHMKNAENTPNDTYDYRTASRAASGSVMGINEVTMTGWYRSVDDLMFHAGNEFKPVNEPKPINNAQGGCYGLVYHRKGDFRGFIYAGYQSNWPTYYESTDGLNWKRIEFSRDGYAYDDAVKDIAHDSVVNEVIMLTNNYASNTYIFNLWNMKGAIQTGKRVLSQDWCPHANRIDRIYAQGQRLVIQTDSHTNTYDWIIRQEIPA